MISAFLVVFHRGWRATGDRARWVSTSIRRSPRWRSASAVRAESRSSAPYWSWREFELRRERHSNMAGGAETPAGRSSRIRRSGVAARGDGRSSRVLSSHRNVPEYPSSANRRRLPGGRASGGASGAARWHRGPVSTSLHMWCWRITARVYFVLANNNSTLLRHGVRAMRARTLRTRSRGVRKRREVHPARVQSGDGFDSNSIYFCETCLGRFRATYQLRTRVREFLRRESPLGFSRIYGVARWIRACISIKPATVFLNENRHFILKHFVTHVPNKVSREENPIYAKLNGKKSLWYV